MNEDTMETISPDQGDVLAASDPGTEVVEVSETVVAEVVEPEPLFMAKPFSEYTVSEGLLLLLVLLTVIQMCIKIVKGGFWWL